MEAEAEAQVAANSHGHSLAILDEEVFVSQLRRRARILDDGFQAAVLRAVQAFALTNCVADKQSLAGVEIGCKRAISLDDPKPSVSLLHLNSPDSTGGNYKMDQGSLAFWHKYDEHGGKGSERDHARQPISLQSRISSRMMDKDLEEQTQQSSTSGWRAQAGRGSSSAHDDVVTLECNFRAGPGQVDVQRAPVKTAGRMLEKLAEYAFTGAAWPLTGCILDPVRASVICAGPAAMVEMLVWFEEHEEQTGLKVVRVKNQFGFKNEDLVGSYRDLMVCVLYRAANDLAIIGEIQVAIAIGPEQPFLASKSFFTVFFDDCTSLQLLM